MLRHVLTILFLVLRPSIVLLLSANHRWSFTRISEWCCLCWRNSDLVLERATEGSDEGRGPSLCCQGCWSRRKRWLRRGIVGFGELDWIDGTEATAYPRFGLFLSLVEAGKLPTPGNVTVGKQFYLP